MEPDLLVATRLSERLVAARRAQRRAAHDLAVLLVELVEGGHHKPLGYASMEEFASVVLDLTARQARDLVRIGRALPELPRCAAALQAGELEWTKAREIVRVAVPETEEAWIERAKTVPSRTLEQLVSRRWKGQAPPDADDREDREDRPRFTVRMEAAGHDRLRAALAALRMELGSSTEELDDGDLLELLVGQWTTLREEQDGVVSDSRYRVTVAWCPDCGEAHVGEHGVSETIREEAACDVERVELRPGPTEGHVTRSIPPATRRIVLGRAGHRCEVPGCRNRLRLDIHHVVAREHGGDHDKRGLVCLCDGHHRAVHRGWLGVVRRQEGGIVVHRRGGPAG